MEWFQMKLNEVVQKLKVNPELGLTQAEADERLEHHGLNVFEEGEKEGLFQKILHHLKEISTIILLIAAAISAYMAVSTGYGWAKGIVILSIVIINIVLDISQESRAEKALDALKGLNTHHTTVVREGVLNHISAEELVPGDIIELHAGDMVPADAVC